MITGENLKANLMCGDRILIAIDSSEYSLAAAEKGFELAQQLNVGVDLVFVIDIGKGFENVDAAITSKEAMATLKREAKQRLEMIEATYKGRDIVQLMPEGHPAEEIIKTAEARNARMIIMGTHGRTGLAHLLFGSVAEHVVRNATIPIMVIPRKRSK